MKLKSKPQAKKTYTKAHNPAMAAVPNIPKGTTGWLIEDRKILTHKSTAQVSNADFVKAWMTLKTNQEVADKLGLTKEQASAKATSLRAKGVNLPKKLVSSIDPNSVDALNKIVKRYSK